MLLPSLFYRRCFSLFPKGFSFKKKTSTTIFINIWFFLLVIMAEDITEKKEGEELKGKIEELGGVPPEHKEHLKKPQKLKWGRIVVILVIIAVVIAAIVLIVTLTKKSSELETITLDYSFSADGELLSEGTQAFALSSDDIIADTFGFKTNEIDKKVSGLGVGDESEFVLSENDAFGSYDENKVFKVNRTIPIESKTEIEREEDITLDQFTLAFEASPVVGEIYGEEMVKFKVESVEGTTVNLKREGEIGDSEVYIMDYINIKIEDIKEDTIVLKLVLVSEGKEMDSQLGLTKLKLTSDENYIYYTLNPVVGDRFEYEERPEAAVLDFDDEYITMDANHPYAGKDINVKIKVTEKGKQTVSSQKIPGAPTLEVFVMSYCPYGTQMQKTLIPVQKLLGNKANIIIRYVSYTMHGQQEEDENHRQICIREEQASKFWTYLECFLEAGDYEGCLDKAKIDKDKLDDCLKSNVEMYFGVDKDLNTKYGVKGSPAIMLDEKTVSVDRNPEAVKNLICNAFKTKPKECDTQLSTEQSSPGFGFQTGGASGVC